MTGVYDYTSQNKFPGTTISSTILCMRRQVSADFCYRDMEQERELRLRKEQQGEKWVFDNAVVEGQIRFGDWFQVSNTVATLCNDAFLLEDDRQKDGYYILPNGDRIEEEVVKPAVSRKRRDEACAMIFPYAYEAGELWHYTDEEFRERFPCAMEHPERFRERLKKRASDKNSAWFEYGRGQALQKIQYRKAVIPSILTNRVSSDDRGGGGDSLCWIYDYRAGLPHTGRRKKHIGKPGILSLFETDRDIYNWKIKTVDS